MPPIFFACFTLVRNLLFLPSRNKPKATLAFNLLTCFTYRGNFQLDGSSNCFGKCL
uniref:Uncharacterized protein n=1 Tax=Populus trichocarpa TaxID=3694 RepID=U7DT99_POPTR